MPKKKQQADAGDDGEAVVVREPTQAEIESGRYKISRALVELTCSHVFHASIIMRLTREEDLTMPFAMGTDGFRLLVNPAMCSMFKVNELQGILAHEAMHVAGRHPLRKLGRDPMTWNVACDAVVNDQVGKSNLAMPNGGVPPIEDETPEHLYQRPPKKLQDFQKKLQDQLVKLVDTILEPKGPGGRPLTQAERQQAEQEAKQWVEAAANAAKRAGQLDANMERFVKRELRSVVHWKEVLARFVTEKRQVDFSMARPNKRYIQHGFYLPTLKAMDVPRVMVAPDMSGSISPTMAEAVVAEVIAVLEMMGDGAPPEVPVLWFDHACYPQVVSDTDELKPRGGGGTDYAPVMREATKLGEDFKGLVVVTDGYCGSFGEAPPMEVLWVLTHDHAEGFNPPFGEVALVLEEHR